MSLVWQYLVIALLLGWSLGYVVQRQFPGRVRRWRARCALWLLRDGRSERLRRLGRRIAPAPARQRSGCATPGCGGCEPPR